MAEDFSASFGLGADDKHIAPADMAGVALASVKSLNEKLKVKDSEIRELKTQLQAQTTQNTQLAKRLEALEAIVASLSQ